MVSCKQCKLQDASGPAVSFVIGREEGETCELRIRVDRIVLNEEGHAGNIQKSVSFSEEEVGAQVINVICITSKEGLIARLQYRKNEERNQVIIEIASAVGFEIQLDVAGLDLFNAVGQLISEPYRFNAGDHTFLILDN